MRQALKPLSLRGHWRVVNRSSISSHTMNKLLFCLSLLFISPGSWAQTMPATTQLDAQASQSVDNDELWVSLSVSREGPNTHDITQAVLAQLQAATAQAKRVDGVQLQVGQVNTTPIWDNKGKTGNWSAQAELVLVSKNTAALSQLSSDLTRLMRINSVQYRLSNEKRLATEKALIQTMAVNFRDKASSISQSAVFPNPWRSWHVAWSLTRPPLAWASPTRAAKAW